MTSDLCVPTACDSCDRIGLAAPGLEGAAKCRFCAGSGHVVPGESYRADDSALFDRIECAVHAAHLSELTSQRLWTTLSNVPERRRRPELLLLPVVKAIPELQFIREVFAEDRALLSHAIGMILVVIGTHLHALELRQALAGQPADASQP